MGTEYWVADRQKKTFFDLGRGSWYDFVEDFGWALADSQVLGEAIFQDWTFKGRFSDLSEDENRQYASKLGAELHRCFGDSDPKNLIASNDMGDDHTIMRAKGYACVGTRYYLLDQPEEHEKEMKENNRHLDQDYRKRYERFREDECTLDTQGVY